MGYVKHGVLSPLDEDTRQKVVNVFLNDSGDQNYILDF